MPEMQRHLFGSYDLRFTEYAIVSWSITMDDQITSRRDLLKRTGVLAMGMLTWPGWMPRVALGAPDRATQGDILVCIFMRGAADGLNLVVPYGDKDYYAHRDTLALK